MLGGVSTRTAALVAAGASTALAAGSAVAWSRDTRAGWREPLAALGLTPGLAGIAAGVAALPLLAHPRSRPWARTALAVGSAAALGMAAGTAIAHASGARPPQAVLEDEQLPPADEARAKEMARETLAGIDRTKADIVLWAPGTKRKRVPAELRAQIARVMGTDVSVSKLPTRPDYDITQGVADTAAALQIVLTELDRTRRPGQRILLIGESQGAWALGTALTDPDLRSVADRVVLWGNPGVAPHQFEDGHDPGVIELTDTLDVVSHRFRGDAPSILDALHRTFDGEWWHAWRLPAIAMANPGDASLLARSGLRLLTPGGYGRDPHNYREHFGVVTRLLADAPRPDS